MFEYGAILKGSQTVSVRTYISSQFEYGAILKGSQTYDSNRSVASQFEYGAILKGSQTRQQTNFAISGFEYGAILKGSQTCLDAALYLALFEYGAILKGSQTIGSGRCIIARKSEFSAFLRFRVEIFLVLVYIISGICTTIRIGRLLGSFTIQRRGKGSFLFGYSCLRASALQNAR